MTKTVGAQLEISAESECDVELQIAVAPTPGLQIADDLRVTHENGILTPAIVSTPQHGRMHTLTLPPGRTTISYQATVAGQAEVFEAEPLELSAYRRPSRYAPSDAFAGFAQAEFGHLEDDELLPAVAAWVGTRLTYVPGSSEPTDGAADTLLSGAGVCRDYAHLVIAMFRALGVPARLTAVYAPGCDPMDFHAVVEAYVHGGWYAVDATALAPRSTLVRIATGRDAADTAFLSNYRGKLTLDSCVVTAVADDGLPDDDLSQRVQLR